MNHVCMHMRVTTVFADEREKARTQTATHARASLEELLSITYQLYLVSRLVSYSYTRCAYGYGASPVIAKFERFPLLSRSLPLVMHQSSWWRRRHCFSRPGSSTDAT